MRIPAFWSAVIFILGVWLGRTLNMPDLFLFFIAITSFIGGLVCYLKKFRIASWVIVGSALFLAGLFRVGLDSGNLPNNNVSHFNNLGEYVTVYGEIVREPDLRPAKTYLTLGVDSLNFLGTVIPVSGQVLVKLKYLSSEYNYADYVMVGGFLSTPLSARNPGSFDYQKYLLTKKIRSLISIKNPEFISLLKNQSGNILLKEIVIPLRQYILGVFNRYLETPQNSLISGFLIGETRFIPKDIFDNFRDTGTLHLLAVSGSNVVLVVGTLTFFLFLLRVPLRFRYILSFFVVLLFCNLSYNQPSVIRASVMVGLFLLGRLAYRKVNYTSIISVAIIFILMFDPLMLWDVGFQLSFVAAFGLISLLPLILSRIKLTQGWRTRIPNFILITFFSSLIAQLAVAPILAYNFNTVPLIGIISNLIIVPLSSIAVVLAMVLTVVGWLPVLAGLVGQVGDFVLRLTIICVNYFADLMVIKLNLSKPDWYLVAGYYLILVLSLRVIFDRKALKYLLITVLILANIMIWKGFLHTRDQSAYLTVLDSGKSQLIHLETVSRDNILFSASLPIEVYDPVERVLSPYLINQGIRTIDSYQALAGDSAGYVREGLELAAIKLSETDCIDRYTNDLSLPDSLPIHLNIYDKNIYICSQSSMLANLSDSDNNCIDLIITPEAQQFDKKYTDLIKALEPQSILFSSYKYLFSQPAGYHKFCSVMDSLGIEHYSVRANGAVQVQITPQAIAFEPVLK